MQLSGTAGHLPASTQTSTRMKTQLLTLLFAAGTLTGFAQEWKKDRPVSNFTSLSVDGGMDVYLRQGNAERVTFEVKGLDEADVRADVKDGVLRLYTTRAWSGNSWSNRRSVKAYVTFRQLRHVQADRGSDVFGEGTLRLGDLNVQMARGSDLKLALEARELNLQLGGGSDATLTGTARTLNADCSGGSDLRARDLRSEVCHVVASGGSDAYVFATKEFVLKAAGGSDVYYSGPGRVLSQVASGSSDITAR